MGLGPIEAPSLACGGCQLEDLGQAPAERAGAEPARQRGPLLIIEPGTHRRTVEVFQRTAARRRADKLHETQLSQDPHVIADVAKPFAERLGELIRARDTSVVEALKDPRPQR